LNIWCDDWGVGPDIPETGERTFELAVVAGFVPVQQFERARVVIGQGAGQGADGDECLSGKLQARANSGLWIGFVDLVVEPGGFPVPEAHLPPAGDGHVLDQRFVLRNPRDHWRSRAGHVIPG
jgi:hypothetical protein